MYEIYTTPAYVISSVSQGESDCYVRFYTKDLGLIGAIVSGARKEISKHRYSIQPYSFASISIVKGKHSFRLTGIEHQEHIALGKDELSKKTVGYVTKLIEMLVRGQERDYKLYALIEELLIMVSEFSNKSEDNIDIELYEIYIVSRLLDHLGYFNRDFIENKNSESEEFFAKVLPTEKNLLYIEENRDSFIEYINKSINESQL